ncbi:hypothetical protein M426DRAFT_18303 [Hypoxylon sp. CI-4A]|nr:hypothetical protein M426DRAFT_18303 [Hypoxylon sp. CI-4A]
MSFDILPDELLIIIIGMLPEVDGPKLLALKNANLTCRQWHSMATPLLFKHIHLQHPCVFGSRTYHLLEFLGENEHLQPYVLEATVHGDTERYRYELGDRPEVSPQFKNLRNVRTVGFGASSFLGDIIVYSQGIARRLLRETGHGPLGRLPKNTVMSNEGCSWVLSPKDPVMPLTECPRLVNCALPLYLTSYKFCLGFLPTASSWKQEYTERSKELHYALPFFTKLEHLGVELAEATAGWFPVALCHAYEVDHALENVNPLLMPPLKSLALHGNFHITDCAWYNWSLARWSQLESLSLAGASFIHEFATRMKLQELSSLETLKMSTHVIECEREVSVSQEQDPAVRDFLLPRGVSHLSLTGYPPSMLMDYLRHDPQNAARLKKLRFHGYESHMQLSVFHIKKMPQLQWLGTDVNRYYLPSRDEPNRQLILLDAIAELRKLTKLRIFVPHDEEAEGISESDALRIFRHIRSRKQGCVLEQLVICRGLGGTGGLWILWPWNETSAVMEHTSRMEYNRPSQLHRRTGIWDTRSLTRSEAFPAGFTSDSDWRYGESEDSKWGIADGCERRDAGEKEEEEELSSKSISADPNVWEMEICRDQHARGRRLDFSEPRDPGEPEEEAVNKPPAKESKQAVDEEVFIDYFAIHYTL